MASSLWSTLSFRSWVSFGEARRYHQDAEELSAAIERLLPDASYRTELGRNAIDTARKNSINNNIDAYLSLLEGIRFSA